MTHSHKKGESCNLGVPIHSKQLCPYERQNTHGTNITKNFYRPSWEISQLEKSGRHHILVRNINLVLVGTSHFVRLTDGQWEVIKHFLNWQRKRAVELRNVFDAIIYITRTGIQWRNLPYPDFPDWQAVYYYFDKWKKNGTIEKINLALNIMERIQNKREATPSLGLVDSPATLAYHPKPSATLVVACSYDDLSTGTATP